MKKAFKKLVAKKKNTISGCIRVSSLLKILDFCCGVPRENNMVLSPRIRGGAHVHEWHWEGLGIKFLYRIQVG